MEWEQLADEAHEGERLELKGFLVQAAEGTWFLTSEPNLKSCCLGTTKKQVALEGNFSKYAADIPLHIKGTFHTAYVLSDIEVISKQSFPFWTLGALLICLVVGGLKLKRLLLP